MMFPRSISVWNTVSACSMLVMFMFLFALPIMSDMLRITSTSVSVVATVFSLRWYASVLKLHILQLHIQLLVALREALIPQNILSDDALRGHGLILLHHPIEISLHLPFIGLKLVDFTLELSALLVDGLAELLHHFYVRTRRTFECLLWNWRRLNLFVSHDV